MPITNPISKYNNEETGIASSVDQSSNPKRSTLNGITDTLSRFAENGLGAISTAANNPLVKTAVGAKAGPLGEGALALAGTAAGKGQKHLQQSRQQSMSPGMKMAPAPSGM